MTEYEKLHSGDIYNPGDEAIFREQLDHALANTAASAGNNNYLILKTDVHKTFFSLK